MAQTAQEQRAALIARYEHSARFGGKIYVTNGNIDPETGSAVSVISRRKNGTYWARPLTGPQVMELMLRAEQAGQAERFKEFGMGVLINTQSGPLNEYNFYQFMDRLVAQYPNPEAFKQALSSVIAAEQGSAGALTGVTQRSDNKQVDFSADKSLFWAYHYFARQKQFNAPHAETVLAMAREMGLVWPKEQYDASRILETENLNVAEFFANRAQDSNKQVIFRESLVRLAKNPEALAYGKARFDEFLAIATPTEIDAAFAAEPSVTLLAHAPSVAVKQQALAKLVEGWNGQNVDPNSLFGALLADLEPDDLGEQGRGVVLAKVTQAQTPYDIDSLRLLLPYIPPEQVKLVLGNTLFDLRQERSQNTERGWYVPVVSSVADRNVREYDTQIREVRALMRAGGRGDFYDPIGEEPVPFPVPQAGTKTVRSQG